MGTFVALLRGVMPTNPNLRNDRLADALKTAGCTEIKPVLASGNLVFQSTTRSPRLLETRITAALHDRLGMSLDVMVRSQAELQAIVKQDPFQGAEHGKTWYLTVMFRPDGQPPVFTKLERAKMNGPNFMTDLEQRYGKHITTRTWNTVLKIVAKMGA